MVCKIILVSSAGPLTPIGYNSSGAEVDVIRYCPESFAGNGRSSN
jgi:hypothetical protein